MINFFIPVLPACFGLCWARASVREVRRCCLSAGFLSRFATCCPLGLAPMLQWGVSLSTAFWLPRRSASASRRAVPARGAARLYTLRRPQGAPVTPASGRPSVDVAPAEGTLWGGGGAGEPCGACWGSPFPGAGERGKGGAAAMSPLIECRLSAPHPHLLKKVLFRTRGLFLLVKRGEASLWPEGAPWGPHQWGGGWKGALR